jgi:hypothetical protein
MFSLPPGERDLVRQNLVVWLALGLCHYYACGSTRWCRSSAGWWLLGLVLLVRCPRW